MDNKEIFKGLANAPVFERGVFLQPGSYLLEISKCLVKETRKSGTGFIVEFKVCESSNQAHTVGSKASWFQGLKDKDVAFGALKQFLYATLGYDYNNDTKEKLVREVDPQIEGLIDAAIKENILAKKRLRVTVSMKKTTRGLDFSQHNWQPV